MLEQLGLNELNDYKTGLDKEGERRASLSEERKGSNLLHGNCNLAYNPLNDLDLEERKESIDSQEFLLSDTLNESEDEDQNQKEEDCNNLNDSEDNDSEGMVDKCTNLECRQYMAALKAGRGGAGSRGSITTYISNDHDLNNCVRQVSIEDRSDGSARNHQQTFQDPLTNYNHYCDNGKIF